MSEARDADAVRVDNVHLSEGVAALERVAAEPRRRADRELHVGGRAADLRCHVAGAYVVGGAASDDGCSGDSR